jgi:hypothetical protein
MEFMKSLVERGLAKPASFSEIYNRNYEGVPPQKVEWAVPRYGSIFEISIPLLLLQEHVNIVLSRVEGLRYSWDNAKCIWIMEYGTEPMENKYTGVEFRQIKMGKMAALCAACDAVRRFPHLIADDNFYDDEPVELVQMAPHWCKMELRVYSDHSKECLFVHLNRMTGDHTAHWNIWMEISRYFQQNNLFLSRSSFLQLTEGIEYDKSDPKQKYLFDDMLVKELCTFMIV